MMLKLNRQLRKCVSLFERLHSHEELRNVSSSVIYRQTSQSQAIGAIDNLYQSILPFKNIEVKIDKEHTLGSFNDTNFVLNVGYVDSSSSGEYTREQKVVVGLHGGTGNHNEMAMVLDHLACDDCRVIMPNFPGNRYAVGVTPHDTDNLKQTSETRGAFIHQFLKAMEIPKVDMIVGHSSGCYALTNFLAKPETNYIKSYALISPGPHEAVSIVRQQYDMIRRIDTLWEKPSVRRALKWVVKLLIRTLGYRMTMDECMLLLRLTANFEVSKVPGQLEAMQKRQLPGLLFYSLNDVYFINDTDLLKRYAELLGISDKDFTVYDRNEKLVQQSLTDTYPRGIIFQEGTHYPQFRHPSLMAEHLRMLLDHVKHK